MRRTLLTAVVSTAAILASGLAVAQHLGHHDHTGHAGMVDDTRVLVNFPHPLVEHTLANMRDHLLTLQRINDALAHGHNDEAAKLAEERLGMSSLPLHGAEEVAKYMPKGMQEAGTAMHRAASRFAIEVRNSEVTGDLKPALGALSEVMNACTGCHASYRLR